MITRIKILIQINQAIQDILQLHPQTNFAYEPLCYNEYHMVMSLFEDPPVPRPIFYKDLHCQV